MVFIGYDTHDTGVVGVRTLRIMYVTVDLFNLTYDMSTTKCGSMRVK